MKKIIKIIKNCWKWCWATLPRRIVCILVISSIIISSIWFLFLRPSPVEAAWFDQDWLYRRSIPITNNTTAETNRYVSVTIDTSDTTKFQTDCGDLRFTKLDGTLMKYYISSGCLSASTIVHVLFDTLPAGSQTIYYYYANPSASNGFEGTDFSTVASNYTVGSIGSEEKGQGPVLWLKFDEGYGTTAFDFTDQGNDFTLSAESWTDSGKFSRAWDGDGSKYLSKTDDADFDFIATDDFSISGWFKHDTISAADYIVAKHQSGTAGGYKVYMDADGDIVFAIDDDGTWGPEDSVGGTLSKNYDDNTWHHFTAIKTGTSTIELYVDGISLGSTAVTSSGTLANAASIYIGIDADGSSGAFDGELDEIKIYRYARTAAQVKRDYNQGFGVRLGGEYTLPSGLVGYWDFEEGSGTTVLDRSGNGNNGTVNGNPVWKGGTDCKFGSCLSFDGNDFVNLGALVGDYAGVTVSVWVNFNSVALGGRVVTSDLNNTYDWVLYLGEANRCVMEDMVTGNSPRTPVLSTGIWYHIVGIRTPNTIYLNGVVNTDGGVMVQV